VAPAGDDGEHGLAAEVGGLQAAAHVAGRRADVGRAADAELAEVVPAPAQDGPRRLEKGAGMNRASDDGEHGLATEVDGLQVATHVARRRADVGRAADAELAVVVPTPALDGPRRLEQGTGMILAGDDGEHGLATEVDGLQVAAHVARRRADVGPAADAELAVVVVAPAQDGPRRLEQGAVVITAGDDGEHGLATEVDGLQVATHVARRRADAVRGAADAELAVVVVAPAQDGPRRLEQSTGMILAGDDGEHGLATEVDGLQVATHVARRRADGGRAADAELAVVVPTPARDTPRHVELGAGMIQAG